MTSRAPRLRLDTRLDANARAAFSPILSAARNLGIGICGTRGIGKSQLLRLIAWIDFVHHRLPVFLIDPVGATTDAILAHVCRFRAEDQANLWPRITYVDLTPTETAVPLPLYYRTGIGQEDLFAISQRLPDALGTLDPKLREASVEGFNSLWELSTNGGQILAALGYQPCELKSLLQDDPTVWMGRLRQALRSHPEITEAVSFFTERYFPLSPGARQQRTRSLVTKLNLLGSAGTKAQFCADHPGLDWQGILRDKRLVIFDLRGEHAYEIRQFKMTWLLLSLLDFLRRVGAQAGGDRSQPIALMIDELSALFRQGGRARNPVTEHLDAFINQQSRNFNVYFTCAYQEFYQLPHGSRETMLSLGTQFFGRVTDKDSLDVIRHKAQLYGCAVPELIDPLTGEADIPPRYVAQLPTFTYLVSVTANEGAPPLPLRRYSVRPFVPAKRPAAALVADARAQLTRRDGLSIAQLLSAIDQRKQAPSPDFVFADGGPRMPRLAPPPTGFDDADT